MGKNTKNLFAGLMVSLAVYMNTTICKPLRSGSEYGMGNPALMMGTDFLSLFQAYYKIED